jgi:hypothetical protein
MTSPIYRSPLLYELIMRTLYGRHYGARYSALAELVPENASVVEVCSGPGLLYRRALRDRNVSYTGLDISPAFLAAIRAAGGDALRWDVRDDAPLPQADYVLMQASLYHFIDTAPAVLDRMLAAAGREVIVAEPIRNLTSGRLPLARRLGALANPGTGAQPHRYTEQTLDRLLDSYGDRLRRSFLLPGGREKAYVIGA